MDKRVLAAFSARAARFESGLWHVWVFVVISSPSDTNADSGGPKQDERVLRK